MFSIIKPNTKLKKRARRLLSPKKNNPSPAAIDWHGVILRIISPKPDGFDASQLKIHRVQTGGPGEEKSLHFSYKTVQFIPIKGAVGKSEIDAAADMAAIAAAAILSLFSDQSLKK